MANVELCCDGVFPVDMYVVILPILVESSNTKDHFVINGHLISSLHTKVTCIIGLHQNSPGIVFLRNNSIGIIQCP